MLTAKMEIRKNGARLTVGSNQGSNLIDYHLVPPLLQWACLWWTRWSLDKQSSLPWAACRSVEAGGEEGHLSTRAESVLCGPQTNNDKAKCDFISLVLKQIIQRRIPVSMIVGHVLIFTEAAASLERRILVRCWVVRMHAALLTWKK